MFLMLHSIVLNKTNISEIFSLLADEYKKAGGEKQINIYIVGGAAIVIIFDYRLSTMDIDAFFYNDLFLNKAKDVVKEKMNLPNDWLNSNFVQTHHTQTR